MPFAKIEDAIADIADGRMVIVVDDQDRENEGDMIMAAEKVTAEDINFLAKYARGLICVPSTRERLGELRLDCMVSEAENTSKMHTRFTISVDAVHGTSTGISAADRAKTVQVMADPKAQPEDLARPGHIFPLMASPGGVLTRAGHTEAVVDLMRLAGFYPVGVLCEVMNDDGTMARVPDLESICADYDMKMITIADLIEYRFITEKLVRRLFTTKLPTRFGQFILHVYGSSVDEDIHMALVMGDVDGAENVLVRVHSQCMTGDVFRSLRCDCGDQLDYALLKIAEEGQGVLVYMRQEGRGIGLLDKLRAYVLQDEGMDTVEANILLGHSPDIRRYGHGAQILADLGLSTIRLLTNNPKKRVGLESYNLKVVEMVPIVCTPTEENLDYLRTKRDKLGHTLGELGKETKDKKRS